MIETPIDKIFAYLVEHKKSTLVEISKNFSIDRKTLENILHVLELQKFVAVKYTLSPMSSTTIEPLVGISAISQKMPVGKAILEYDIIDRSSVKLAKAFVIKPDGGRATYYIDMPSVSDVTKAYTSTIKNEISSNISDGISHDKVREVITEKLSRELGVKDETLIALCNYLMRDMYGLGDLDIVISDPNLEEIIVNSSKAPVAVYHRKHGWLRSNIIYDTEEDIANISSQIARKIGKQISILNPILDAHLGTGDRVNATFFPISNQGNTLTLRLFSRDPWTIISLIKSHTISLEMVALLWQALHYEMNVIVGGGTGSGKTSTLNSLLALIPSYQRIITIEDTRELVLPKYQWNWVPMITRSPNPEGLGEVTMLDLVINSLRMRPDRIIMGEIRRKKEAEVLFEAMHTGHSVYGTIHANTGAQIIKRLIEPPIEVPSSEVEDVNLVLVQYRDRRRNIRRSLEISEVLPGSDSPKVNQLYHWRPRGDVFESVKTPQRYFEELNLHTGMTDKETISDQNDKKKVLDWMLKYNIENINQVGLVIEGYYSSSLDLLDAISKKQTPQKFFGDALV